MSEPCKWLHCQLEKLPFVKYPFDISRLPLNGIYFFYEECEFWGHGENIDRIVRIGTHRNGNFGNRINEHFLISKSDSQISINKPKYSDRSIFRKNIGRALLNRDKDKYLQIWDIDFTGKKNREKYGSYRDIKKEETIEGEISNIIRDNFRFRFVTIDIEADRMGRKGLESYLIGTVSRCELCRPSIKWLGNYSPEREIRASGLWQKQHLAWNIHKKSCFPS